MRCLIFAGGEFIDLEWHRSQIQPGDYLIGVDKGAEYLSALGYLPDVVIGDLDSIDDSVKGELLQEGVEFMISVEEKDETDTELALIHGLSLNPTEILLFTAFGGRLDHFLANVFLLVPYLKKKIPIYFLTPTQKLWLTDESITIIGSPNQLISLMAISEKVTNLSLKGFYYPLQNETLKFGSTLGISNIMLEETGKIDFTNGILLVIINNI